ncbi:MULTISPECIES: hypothetical protein [unclassified Streptomyces]|uniref:hypothetical protein n=1 Tax=unclassified Streptomyces TaxID=2593676 RepID=UPI00341C199E
MNHVPLYGDPCPLCRRPLRIEYGRARPSAQLDRRARVWVTGYHCAHCEAVRPREWAEVMRERYENG